MLPARDLFNRFPLHARHVLRAVASGQGAGDEWPPCHWRARQRVADACRARRVGGPGPGARREEARWLAAATTAGEAGCAACVDWS